MTTRYFDDEMMKTKAAKIQIQWSIVSIVDFVVRVVQKSLRETYPWRSGQLARLPGKRPRDQFPPQQ